MYPVFNSPDARSPKLPPPYDSQTWNEACRILAGFTGLQDLTLYLAGHSTMPRTTKLLLEPLYNVRPARRFDVVLLWFSTVDWLELHDCPFRVMGTKDVA